MHDKQSAVAARLAQARARRAELDEALALADRQVEELSNQLAQLKAMVLPPQATGSPTPAAKVALFRSMFRGRTDVWPRLWQNAKTGKKGYAPVCGHDWRPGVCGKPKVKCGACPNQAFLAVTDTVLQDHLQGRHVAGVYVLLPDDTCTFLAADFDDAHWQADVLAYAQFGRSKGIDVAIERSRSGSGAHAWIFFEESVPAATARKLGSLVLTGARTGLGPERHAAQRDAADAVAAVL